MAIKTRYDAQLQQLLYEVYETGFARVRWDELLRWLAAERATKRVYEELLERWGEIVQGDEKAWRLGLLNWRTGYATAVLTLVCMDPANTPAKEASLVAIGSKVQ